MMKSLIVLLALFIHISLNGQLLVTDPPLPQSDQPVEVIFDASLGSGGLAGYSGDVYAHTGVITQYSGSGSDWKYVKTDWGENTPDTKMTRIGQDLYSLQIGPSIREYYGVPPNEQILQMAFVFRSATMVDGQWLEGKTETGGDIFAAVYEPGLNLSILQPQQFPVIKVPGESFIVEVAANQSDTLSLTVDGIVVKITPGDYLIDTILAENYGNHQAEVRAWNEEASVVDSFTYHVRGPVTIGDLPAGIHDGINYTGPVSATLCLLAPHKEFIYVTGDFNDWEIDSNYYMRLTPDSLRFWLEIDGLIPGKEYVFQYFVDGQVRIGDPYADKVSDPWNDGYIDDQTYPGLIEYPSGKTTGIATVLQTNQPPYSWQSGTFTPVPVTDLVIYEILVRDFTEFHTFEALEDTLDYLQRLGITAIELMPVNEFEGNIGWGYNPSYYFAPDKYYGPKDKLKALIDECHQRGIAVIIDMVLNHAYDQCPLVQLYFDGDKPTYENPWFNVDHNFENPDAQWGNDFNHESPFTQQLVDSINSYWMSEYHVDGFRFDFTKGIGNNFKDEQTDPWGSIYDADRIALLKRMSDEIWERNPGAIVIMEHLADNSEEKVLADYGILLWGNLSGKYQEAAMGFHDSGKSDFSWISYKKRNWNEPHLIGYMESHDEERLMYKCLQWGAGEGDYQITDTTTALLRMQLDALFFLTVPGPKMIWQFGEMGYDYSIEYNGRLGPKPVRWDYLNDYRRKYLVDFYSALIDLRNSQPIFETADFTMTVAAEMKKIVFSHPQMNAVIAGNFGITEGSMSPGFQHTGIWYEYFTGDPYEVTTTDQLLTLGPGEYRLFTDVQLETPQIGTGTGHDFADLPNFLVYPNPSDHFYLEFDLTAPSKVSLSVFNILGYKQARIEVGTLPAGFNRLSIHHGELGSGVASGIYFLELESDSFTASRKIVIP